MCPEEAGGPILLWMWVCIPPGRSSALQVTLAPGHPPSGQGGGGQPWPVCCLPAESRPQPAREATADPTSASPCRSGWDPPPPPPAAGPTTCNFPTGFLGSQGLSPCVSLRLPSGSLDTQSCQSLCDPTDCSPPGSSVHGILQARTLEWGATSRPRDGTRVSCLLHWQVMIQD